MLRDPFLLITPCARTSHRPDWRADGLLATTHRDGLARLFRFGNERDESIIAQTTQESRRQQICADTGSSVSDNFNEKTPLHTLGN